jgi:antitoxin MazE
MFEQISIPIIRVGSSRGIRIPKKILERLGFKERAVAVITDESITLKAARKPREGWEVDFKRCRDADEEDVHIPDEIDTGLWEEL